MFVDVFTILRVNCAAVVSVPSAVITGKHPWCSEVGSVSKRQRKAVTVEVKMDVFLDGMKEMIVQLIGGMRWAFASPRCGKDKRKC